MKIKRGDDKKVIYLFIRYLALILLALGSFWLFYYIFTPLTVYPVLWLIKLFYPASLAFVSYSGNIIPSITLNNASIQLVSACIAGVAYYLLVILNLSIPMNAKKRVYSLAFSLLAFLIINILRIVFFSFLLIKSLALFELTHLIFWYFLSSIIVFLVWLAEIKIFKITDIPIYTDIKFLYSKTRRK